MFSSKRKNDDKPENVSRLRNVIIGLFLLSVIAGIGFMTRTPSPPPVSPLPGRITYLRSDPLTKRFVVVDLQTGYRSSYVPSVLPTHMPTEYDAWKTSPDGNWQSRWIEAPLKSSAFFLEITNNETHVTNSVGPIYDRPDVIWASNSQSVFFLAASDAYTDATYDPYKVEIWRVDIPTHQLIRLTNNSDQERMLYPSPDGTKLAYVTASNGENQLHVMDLATGQSTMPLPDKFILFFSWSPDGQWIAFETNDANGLSDIWVARADGSERQGIALEPDAWEQSPIWQP